MLAFISDYTVWQSNNEGFTWKEAVEGKKFVAMIMHTYSRDRAYLVSGRTIHYTTDKGRSWYHVEAPIDANALGITLLDFHPTRSDWLIWTGSEDCVEALSDTCRAVAYYTTDNGRRWHKIEEYVRVCTWARDRHLKIDERLIFCESFREKKGSQRAFDGNPLQLIAGTNYYSNKRKLADSIAGFATFEEFMVIAEVRFITPAPFLRRPSSTCLYVRSLRPEML